MRPLARWRAGAIAGCRWELNDPLFWPRWLWASALGGCFLCALMLGAALWVAPGVEALRAARAGLDRALAQQLDHRAALDRLLLLREQAPQHAEYRQALDQAFAAPARPLEALSSLALEQRLEIARLVPLGEAHRPRLELSLEGDFAALSAFMLAPSPLGAVTLGDLELRRVEEGEASRLALRLELGWHPEAAPGAGP